MTTQDNSPQIAVRQRQRSSFEPTIAILIIATVVFFAVNGSSDEHHSSRQDANFRSKAFLSGIDRRISSSDFRRGEASAILGGIDLDLREATMQGNEATLDISAIMGGVDIRIPRDWTVINHITPILGGVDDNTLSTGSNKRLILEGTVIMGGFDIKN
jgi:predicted membrane protein